MDELHQRDLKMGELFRLSFQIYQDNLLPILWILVCLYLPISILHTVVTGMVNANVAELEHLLLLYGLPNEAVPLLVKNAIYALVLLIVQLLMEPLVMIAVAKMTGQVIDREQVSAKEALLHALSKSGAIIVSGILMILLLVVTGILPFVMLFFIIKLIFYPYALCFSEDTAIGAFQKSSFLTKRRWWATLGRVFLLAFVVGIVSMGITQIFYLAGVHPVSRFLSIFVGGFVGTFQYIFMALWYRNRVDERIPSTLRIDEEALGQPEELDR